MSGMLKSGRPARKLVDLMKVRFQASGGSFEGVLDEKPISRKIIECLPVQARVMRWGEEIYFDVPVKVANTKPTREVRVGDIAYWPEGPCLCIFFGKTPASTDQEPRPASDVTVIGYTDAPVALLRSIKEGAAISLGAC